jgi:hypothetical protein
LLEFEREGDRWRCACRASSEENEESSSILLLSYLFRSPYTDAMLSEQEIVDVLVELTEEYSEIYFATFHKDMDKQLWAALHLGFVAALKLNGYSETILQAALRDAQERLPD